jgi:hypothetical protein
MRRNRRGPGYSGSTVFLSRALSMSEADLIAAFASLGLSVPENPNDKPVYVEIDGAVYWMNKDGRGGIWINGREKREGGQTPKASAGTTEGDSTKADTPVADVPASESTPVPAESSDAAPDAKSGKVIPTEVILPSGTSADDSTANESSSAEQTREASSSDSTDNPALTAVRLLLKTNKRGSGVSGEVGFLARSLDKSEDAFLSTLTNAGLVVPTDSETKPVFVEQGGEIFWLNKNSTDGSLWLNAKAAKSAAKKSTGSRPRTPRKAKSADKSAD